MVNRMSPAGSIAVVCTVIVAAAEDPRKARLEPRAELVERHAP